MNVPSVWALLHTTARAPSRTPSQEALGVGRACGNDFIGQACGIFSPPVCGSWRKLEVVLIPVAVSAGARPGRAAVFLGRLSKPAGLPATGCLFFKRRGEAARVPLHSVLRREDRSPLSSRASPGRCPLTLPCCLPSSLPMRPSTRTRWAPSRRAGVSTCLCAVPWCSLWLLPSVLSGAVVDQGPQTHGETLGDCPGARRPPL